MAISYEAVGNSPCAILRAVAGAGATDAAGARILRVGGPNTPDPAGTTSTGGSCSNPVFFEKLKAAARQLTGATTDSQISAAAIPFTLFFLQPDVGFEAFIHAIPGFAQARLLETPFFEAVSVLQKPPGTDAELFGPGLVTFENAGANAPNYADIGIFVTGTIDSALYIVKLFHSLTA